MFEFSAGIVDQNGMFDKLYNCVLNKTKKYNPLLVFHKTAKYCSFSLATSADNAEYIKLIIKKEIANLIVNDIKYNYFLHKISKNNYFKDNLDKLIMSLVFYDKQIEIKYILDNFPAGNYINIDSFFLFRLAELTNKWNNIVEIINNNLNYLIFDSSFDDLISFFESGQRNIVEIVIGANNIKIYVNNQQNDLNFTFNKQDLQNLIFELISLEPQRLIIYGQKNQRAKLKNMLPEYLQKICEESFCKNC